MFPPLKGTCIGIYDYTTSPYNVTGGANVEIAFVLLQDGSFFILLKKVNNRDFSEESKGGICCVPEGRYEPEFCRP